MAGAMNLGEMTHTLETGLEEALRTGSLSTYLLEQIENGCDTLTQIVERLMAGESPNLALSVVSVAAEEIEGIVPQPTGSESQVTAVSEAGQEIAAPLPVAAAVAAHGAEGETGQLSLIHI